MEQNQVYPHWSNKLKGSQANTHTHVCTWTDIQQTWPSVNPTYKHWGQRQRQINAAGSIYPSLVYLLDFSSKTHASVWLVCWLSRPKHTTAAQTRPSSPASPKQHSKTKKRPTQSALFDTWVLSLKTAALKMSSSPSKSTSKLRKSML